MNLSLLLRIFGPVVIASLVAGLLAFGGYHFKSVAAERDALVAKAATSEEVIKLLKRVEVTTSTVLSARVQSRTAIKQKVQDVQAEIEKRIPATESLCVLSSDWRLLHDAAATGAEVPKTPSRPNARTVTPQDAASTVNENYGRYHDAADQLLKLQQWIKGVSEDEAQ